MFEFTVIVKGEDQTLRRKFLIYDRNVELNFDDEILKEAVLETTNDFSGDDYTVRVKIDMEWN